MNSLCARGPLTIFKQALYLSILPSLLILENLWLLVNICVGIILALIWKGDMLQLTLIYAYKQVEQYYLKGEYVWCIQGVPKKIIFKLIFEFLSLGGVFLGVKNNSKNFGSQKLLDGLGRG